MVINTLSHLDAARAGSNEPFITTREAAEHLGKPASWLYHQGRDSGIPRYKVGNQWRYKRSELDEWVRLGGAG